MNRNVAATTAELAAAPWRTSAHSTPNGNCVEFAAIAGTAAVRDSKDRDGAVLWFGAAAWRDFIATARVGSFDV